MKMKIMVQYYKVKSPPRKTWEKFDALKYFDLQKLPENVSYIIKQNIDTLISFKSQREQICFIIYLLRPNGNQKILATFDQIGSIFHLSRGAIKPHYNRGTDIKECGRKKLLNDDQINIMIDFFSTISVRYIIKMEEERVLCDPELIDLFYELENVLKLGIPSAFIINIDECSFSEWVDTNDIQVIVPMDYEKDSIEIAGILSSYDEEKKSC